MRILSIVFFLPLVSKPVLFALSDVPQSHNYVVAN